MSHNSSSFFDDSFNTSKIKKNTSYVGNTSQFANDTEFNTSIHKLPVHEITPYMPIKSLIDSPFKASQHNHLLDRSNISNSESLNNINDANSLLKFKIKAHQQQFQDNLNKINNPNTEFKTVRDEINTDTYLHSAFKSRRTTSDKVNKLTHLKNIGDKDQKFKPNINVNKSSGTSTQDLNNPYVLKALGRIVNKEYELRKLLYIVLLFFIYRFARSIIRLFVYTNPLVAKYCNSSANTIFQLGDQMDNFIISDSIIKVSNLFKFENVLKFGSYVEYILSLLLILTFSTSLYRLLKPQDKCLDLPLTKGQRKILGLVSEKERIHDENEDDEDDTTEEIMKKLLSSSPQRIEQPTRVVVPESIDDVMGSLNGLVINKGNNNENNGNMTWSAGMFQQQGFGSRSGNGFTGSNDLKQRLSQKKTDFGVDYQNDDNRRRDFVTPSNKYLYGVSQELKNDSFNNANASFY
jgi:hypothetical protein